MKFIQLIFLNKILTEES